MRKITIFLMTSCLVAMSGCSKKEESEAEAPAPVQVTAVTQDTIRRIVAGDGMLFPRDQASVMPKIASPVEKFYVNRGDHVKQGQLLAVLENRDLTAQAAEGQGAMDQAESNLRTTSGASVPEAVVKAQTDVDADQQAMDAAKKVFDSREQLFKEGALAGRQVDEALVSYTQAKSQFEAAQEHLRVLQAVAKEEQIKTASSQVESAKAHHQSLEAQLSYARILQPHRRRRRRPAAVRRRNGHPRHAAAHGDGYLARGGPRQRSAEPGRHGQGGPTGDHYSGG